MIKYVQNSIKIKVTVKIQDWNYTNEEYKHHHTSSFLMCSNDMEKLTNTLALTSIVHEHCRDVHWLNTVDSELKISSLFESAWDFFQFLSRTKWKVRVHISISVFVRFPASSNEFLCKRTKKHTSTDKYCERARNL